MTIKCDTPAAANWQLIETAPKDGTPFIACLRVFQHGAFAYHDMHIVLVSDETGEIHADFYQGKSLIDYEFWRPLPPPPIVDDPAPPSPVAGRRTDAP